MVSKPSSSPQRLIGRSGDQTASKHWPAESRNAEWKRDSKVKMASMRGAFGAWVVETVVMNRAHLVPAGMPTAYMIAAHERERENSRVLRNYNATVG